MNSAQQPTSKRRMWILGRWIGVMLLLYVGGYAVLSATGGWVVTESGEVRLILAVGDTFQWQPRYGSCHRFRLASGDYTLRSDTIGYFFAPLILLDQRFIHRTIRFLTVDGSIIDVAPPISEYHPLRANRWHGRFPYEPSSKRQ